MGKLSDLIFGTPEQRQKRQRGREAEKIYKREREIAYSQAYREEKLKQASRAGKLAARSQTSKVSRIGSALEGAQKGATNYMASLGFEDYPFGASTKKKRIKRKKKTIVI